MENSRGYILYIGGFLNEKIVEERGLPTRNPAGSNRMHRIANALKKSGTNVLIVSPAVSMRTHSSQKWLSSSVQKIGEVPVLFTSAIGLPILGVLSTFVTVPYSLLSLGRRRKVSAVIIYNFSPLLVLLAFLYGIVFRIPVYQNVEDVSFPKLNDWKPETEVRPLQQLVFYFSMKTIAAISRGFIVPARRFMQYLDPTKPYRVVTGCINVDREKKPAAWHDDDAKIHILFSGKIEFEHGIDVFIEALKMFATAQPMASKIAVDICGGGAKSDWLRSEVQSMGNLKVYYHGFVEDAMYAKLLKNSDVCVALQSPHGRFATYKTPSKVYEYLGNAKAVIATEVGDLGELPEEVIVLCKPFNSQTLFEHLKNLRENPKKIKVLSKRAGTYAYEHFSYENVGRQLLSLFTEGEKR